MSIPLAFAYAAPGTVQQIYYQGLLKNSSGALVSDGSYDMVFRLYDAASGGTALWTGTHTAVNGNAISITSGVFTVLLGSGAGNSLSGVDFNQDSLWLGITIASDSEMSPRQRVGAAAQALNADKLDGIGLATSSLSTGDILYFNGSALERLAAGTNGQVLKLAGGIPSWAADSGGGGLFATSSDSVIHPADTSDVLVLGGTATTSTGYIFEVIGSSLFDVINASSTLAVDGHSTLATASTTALTVSGALHTALTTNSVPFIGTSGLLAQDTANFVWDDTNNRLGIGTSTPGSTLSVGGTGVFTGALTAASFTNNTLQLGSTTAGEIDTISGNLTLDSAGGTVSVDDALSVAATTTLASVLNLSSNRILNVATPTSNNDAANKGYVDSFVLGLSWQQPALTIGSTTPPGSPSSGDRHIIASSSASGAWVGEENNIAEWNGSSWAFASSTSGFSAFVSGESAQYTFNGAEWVELGSGTNHANLSGLQGGNGSDQFFHLTQADYNALVDVNAQLTALHTDGTPTFAGITATNATTTNATTTNLYISGALTLNNALPVSSGGTGTTTTQAGGLFFSNGSNFTQDTPNLFWDNTNNRLGIGTSSPFAKLTVDGDAYFAATSTFALGLSLASSTPAVTANTLYNQSGTLFWNGAAFNAAAGGTQGQVVIINSAGTQVATSSLFVATSGNVGIGTTSPSSTLTLGGETAEFPVALKIGESDHASSDRATLQLGENFQILTDISGNGTDNFAIWDGTAFRLAINSGNVGIGSTTPTNRLTVEGGIALASTSPLATQNALYNQGGTLFWNGSQLSGTSLFTDGGTSTYLTSLTDNLAFGTTTASARLAIQSTSTNDILNLFETGGSEVFTVLESGNVGIGTTSPDGRLHVHTASAGNVTAGGDADDLVVENDAAGGISILTPDNFPGHIFFGSESDNLGSYFQWSHDGDLFTLATANPGADMRFLVGDQSEAMRILDNGFVGIGTTSPEFRFHMSGSGNERLLVESTGAQNTEINLRNATDTWALYTAGTDGSFRLWNDGDHMTLLANGNVGIGTTTPVSKLTIAGSITPDAHLAYDLGSTTLRWNTIYASSTVIGPNSTELTQAPDGTFLIREDTTDFVFLSASSSGVGIFTDVADNAVTINGGVTLASTTPATTTNAIYNQGGTLFWNGGEIGGVLTGTEGYALTFDGNSRATTTSALFFGSGGNIGIGTTTPGVSLSVVGSGRFTSTLTAGGLVSGTSFTNNTLQLGSTTAGEIDTISGNLTLDSAGGTVSVDDALSVAATTTLASVLNLSSNRILNVATPTSNNDAANKGYVDSFVLGLSWQQPALTIGSTTPPGSPSSGDRHIIASSSASGAWVGEENNIAEWNGSSWAFASSTSGFSAFVSGESAQYTFNGAEWVELGSGTNHANLSGLQGGNGSDQFFHLTQADYNALVDVNAQLTALHTDAAPTFASTTLGLLRLNSEDFTDLTGFGLLNQSGALAVSTSTFFTLSEWFATTSAPHLATLEGVNSLVATSATTTNLHVSGALSFANALPVSSGGTGTTTAQNGGIFFYNGSNFTQDSSNLFWDNANNRLGIGTTTPQQALVVEGSSASSTPLLELANNSGNFRVFNTNVAPTDSLVGNIGDLAIDSTAGKLYIKSSGTNNASGWAEVGQSASQLEYLQATLTADQSTNLNAGDHVKFDSVARSSGSSITLDTSTAYTSTANVDSIGRFTLQGGKTYRLTAITNVVIFDDATGNVDISWYDADSGTSLSDLGSLRSYTSTFNEGKSPVVQTIYTPSVDTRIEVRLGNPVALTRFGDGTGTRATAIIELIADNSGGGGAIGTFTGATDSSGGTSGLVTAPSAGQQGSFLLGNGSWTAAATLFFDPASNALAIGSSTAANTYAFAIASSTGSSYFGNSLVLASSTPTITANALYNQGGALHWNGNALNGVSSGTEGQTLVFDASGAAVATSSLFIAGNGSVGIGTTTPTSNLHVLTTDNVAFTLEREADEQIGLLFKKTGREWFVGTDLVNNGGDDFFIHDNTVAQPRLVIDGNGNVGIGTTTPNERLTVVTNIDDPGANGLEITNEGAGDPGIRFAATSTGANHFQIFYSKSDGVFKIGQEFLGDWFTIASTTGNVGIGSNAPEAKLHINGVMSGTPNRTLLLENSEAQSTSTRFIDAVRSGTDSEFIVLNNGNVLADGTFSSPADYAEWLETVDTDLAPGELVSIDPENPNHVKRTTTAKDVRLMGVISTKPGILGTRADDITDASLEREGDPRWKKVAFLGQVPTKVTGDIAIGDSITSSELPGIGVEAKLGDPVVCIVAVMSGSLTVSCPAVPPPP